MASDGTTPANLDHWQARGVIRDSFGGALLASFTFAITDNVVTFTLAPEDTVDITVTKGVYDIELYDESGNVSRVVQGSVKFSPGVTY